jgi:hypothetical protein
MQDRSTHIFSPSSIIRTFGRLPALRSLRSGMKVEVFSVGVGPELFGFTEARHAMVARGDSDRRLRSLRRRSQSRERGRRRCIGAGRSGRKAKRVLQRNRCRRRAAIMAAGPAANFLAAFSSSPASPIRRRGDCAAAGRRRRPRPCGRSLGPHAPRTHREPRRPPDRAFEERYNFRQPAAGAGRSRLRSSAAGAATISPKPILTVLDTPAWP